MRKYLFIFMWLSCLPFATRGQTLDDADLAELLQPKQAQAFDYWFDDDTDNLQTITSLSGTHMVDVSSLPNGLHLLHCQVTGADGSIYGIDSRMFLTMNNMENLSNATLNGAKLKYWFDEDASTLQVASGLSGTYLPEVSALDDGLHMIHWMVVAANGEVYSTSADVFIKMEEILTDVTVLTTVSARGIAYWFDDDTDNKKTTNDLSGTYTLDVSSLEDGLHLVHYYVVGEDDVPYGLTSKMFLKNEAQFAVHEPNRITKYTYWVNDASIETVMLDGAANPYTLMTLLPLQTQPIRSSSFHFQMVDGVPMLYAKNDFHIRFYDAQGEFVDNYIDNERTFIDYAVSQQVQSVGELQATQTFDRMGESEIRWYTVHLERGDSVDFKTNKACSIQLFSPSGKEEYNASGARSVKWDGCHASETGTYFLALHDVTAQQGTSITLDYQHIDKYAVLSQDVRIVGNGGYTTISFEGNGFKDLYAIDLINAEQEMIDCISIGIKNNAHITPTFDFTAAKLGVYDAYFHFAEGDIVVKDAITVVEATDITINTKLDTPPVLDGLGKPYYDVVIVCPNGGNNTAYGVPLEVSFKAPKGSITRIDITNPEVPTLAEMLYNDELSDEDWRQIQQISNQLGDTYDFIKQEWVDEETGEEMVTMKIYLATTIAPESSNTIKFQVQAFGDVETEVECPPDWMPIYTIEKIDFPAPKPQSCGILEDVRCAVENFATLTGVVSTIGSLTPASTITGAADCAVSGISSMYGRFVDQYCGGPRETFDPVSFRTVQKTAAVWSPVLSCAMAMIPSGKIAKEIAVTLSGGSAIVTGINAEEQCNNAPGVIIRGLSKKLYSLDPNDIYGYLSPSGSKYIDKDHHEVYYTIEFENDPEQATAAAHDIFLIDQLDASVFDLSSFKPTRINIGGKMADLNGNKNFVTTMDLRPELNVIAQIEGTFDENTGIANWHISSLDPMTMEPTEDALQGVLPVNTDGLGIGQVSFDISLKPGLSHETEINNQASIVFDNNEPIVTPVWTNIMDCMKPESHVSEVVLSDNSMAEVSISATDELSGPWRYDVYVQYGQGSAWFKAVENVDIDKTAKVQVYPGIDHGFCVIATDAAGNVEEKTMAREFSLSAPYIPGDVNADGKVTVTDVIMMMDKAQGHTPSNFIDEAADMNHDGSVTYTDVMMTLDIILNSTE